MIVVEGYASVFWIIDSDNDIVLPGAFRDVCMINTKIPILYQHNINIKIGDLTLFREDSYGLYVIGNILPKYRDIIISNPDYRLSIGYNIVESKYDNICGIHYLIRLNLLEVSVVDNPVNSQARFFSNTPFLKNYSRTRLAI